jgi:hypothetical protein
MYSVTPQTTENNKVEDKNLLTSGEPRTLLDITVDEQVIGHLGELNVPITQVPLQERVEILSPQNPSEPNYKEQLQDIHFTPTSIYESQLKTLDFSGATGSSLQQKNVTKK